MSKPVRVFFGGINGVGKTTLASEFCSRNKFEHVRASSVLMNSLKVRSQRELEEVPETLKTKLMREELPLLVSSLDFAVIDAHYIVCLGNVYDLGSLNEKLAKSLTHLVHLVAEPRVILSRRAKEIEKRARELDIAKIELDQNVSLLFSEYLAKKYDLPLIKVANQDINKALNAIERAIL